MATKLPSVCKNACPEMKAAADKTAVRAVAGKAAAGKTAVRAVAGKAAAGKTAVRAVAGKAAAGNSNQGMFFRR